MKEMIQGGDRKFPGRVDNMFTALANVVPSHLMDRKLFPFTTIEATGKPVVGGDIAFDEDEGCGTPVAGAATISLDLLKRPRAAADVDTDPDD